MVDSGKLIAFVDAVCGVYRGNTAVLVRIAYMLGNLTTNYESARNELNDAHKLKEVMQLGVYYFKQDGAPQGDDKKTGLDRYDATSKSSFDDVLTKVVKLVANLATDEEAALDDLVEAKKDKNLLDEFL
jgi:hypothetical protein